MEKIAIMNLVERMNLLFGGFQDETCRACDGYNPHWRPNWKDEVETELDVIRDHFPIPLPEDYCEIFRKFGGGRIEDKRPNWVIPEMSFWTWDDMKDFDATVGFFEDCPNGFPFGDDIGDVVYFYVDDGTDTSIYMAEKSMTFDRDFWYKIAGSFTELFTSTEAQRLFRNFYRYGCDKGTDGR